VPRIAADGRSVQIDATELAMILDGIDVRTVHRPAHWRPRPKKASPRSAPGIDILSGM
jgi:transposase